MIAVYQYVDDTTLDDLLKLNNEDLIEKLELLQEKEPLNTIDIGKTWDVLHFLLTKKSASTPISGDYLSEGIVGVRVFTEDENADFIAFTIYECLPEIVEAYRDYDVSKLELAFKKLSKKGIYPDTEWDFTELMTEFNRLKDFYEKAFELKKNVVVSIL